MFMTVTVCNYISPYSSKYYFYLPEIQLVILKVGNVNCYTKDSLGIAVLVLLFTSAFGLLE